MTSTAAAMDRSARREVRNPILALPAAQALMALPADQRRVIEQLLKELVADASARAQKSWRTKKPPMAAYWAAVAVYAKHIRAVARRTNP